MNYSLATLWYERSRYIPGIGAVAFSAVLIVLQCGLLLGLFSITAIPIDHTRADIWVGSPEVLSVDLGRPIPLNFLSRVASVEGVDVVEPYYQSFANWTKPGGGSDLSIVIGCKLDDDNLGAVVELSKDLRDALTEPMSVVIDVSEMSRLGINQLGDYAEINKARVRVVGLVKGLKSLAGPYVFCSRQTAKVCLRSLTPQSHTTYLLIKVKNKEESQKIVEKIQGDYTDMSIFTSEQFSIRSRKHWLFKTKAGIALGYTAVLGLLVGMVVTSQTLYAATTASAREYAILLAMGIPRWRILWTVLVLSFWVGLIGTILAYPIVYGLSELGKVFEVIIPLPWELLAAAGVITLIMSTVSGLFALRSVRKIEPMSLLR